MEYRFDEIAFNSTAKKQPEDSDRPYYIGLEHLDTNSLYVSRWGSDVTPVGEKLLMKKGDILFGKRRAYQRKVGIAPFDGIFSAHGMVLRPKENLMDKDFFPFFISSDQFMERAVRISVGGLSPTINWKDLKEQVFDIPSLGEQKALASKLWAAYKLREEYKRLLAATDEMVKSRFIEMFGNPNSNPHCLPTELVSDLFTLQMGKTPARDTARYWVKDGSGNKWISIADMSRYEYFTNDTEEYISESAIQETGMKLIPQNTVIMSFKLTIGRVSVTLEPIYSNEAIVAFIPKAQDYSTRFLYFLVKYYDWLENAALAVKGKTLNKESIGKNRLIIPSRESQNEFAAFAEQADKSKFELKQTIEKIDKVMRALMQ